MKPREKEDGEGTAFNTFIPSNITNSCSQGVRLEPLEPPGSELGCSSWQPMWPPSSAPAHLAALAVTRRGGDLERRHRKKYRQVSPALFAAHPNPPLPSCLWPEDFCFSSPGRGGQGATPWPVWVGPGKGVGAEHGWSPRPWPLPGRLSAPLLPRSRQSRLERRW